MTIDERLEFLRQSTESLHATCQELHAIVAEQNEQANQDRATVARQHRAVLKAMQAYLGEIGGEENNGKA